MDEEEIICCVCGIDENDEYVMLCENCNNPFHTYCTKSCMCCKKKASNFGKIPDVPEGDFYCKLCAGRPPSLNVDPKSQVFVFGCNAAGQLGLGHENNVSVPSIVSGGWNSLLLSNEGFVYSCGDGEHGKTGHVDVVHEHLTHFRLIETLLPKNLTRNSGPIVSISQGRDFAYAVSEHGHVYSWGAGEQGQTGHQAFSDKKAPFKISALRETEIDVSSKISCGWQHSLMISKDGQLMGVGDGRFGQLGTGDTRPQWIPRIITNSVILNPSLRDSSIVYNPSGSDPFIIPDNSILEMATGKNHSLLLLNDGTVYGMGSNLCGQIACRDISSTEKEELKGTFRKFNMNFFRPMNVIGLKMSISQIATGADHSIVLSSTGRVFAFGLNRFHQLGISNSENCYFPTLVSITNSENKEEVNIKMIAAGDNHSLALSRDGHVFSCGLNENGQLGTGDFNSLSRFTLISFPTSHIVNKIFAGGDHNFLVLEKQKSILKDDTRKMKKVRKRKEVE